MMKKTVDTKRAAALAALAAAFAGAACAAEVPPQAPYAQGDGYYWTPRSWKLTPDAERLVAEWNSKPYRRKEGKTAFIVRAQLKYGLNRNDYIHHWYDRPLMQDSSFGQRQDVPTEKRPWLNWESWKRTVAAGRLGKLDAFGVFTFTANREQVIPLSVKPGGEANILVEVALGVKMEECLLRAEQALAMPNSFRIGGKVVITSYPVTPESRLPFFAQLKEELTKRHGDKFVVMPYVGAFEGADARGESFDAARLMAIRERFARILRQVDGIAYGSRDSFPNRRYNPWLFDNVIAPALRSVMSEPEFADRLLSAWATPGHENSYRWNYGLDSTGTRMLRDMYSSIVKLSPDFTIGCEWDEENENTCFRPMVAHGFVNQRLLRHFNDAANRGGKFDVFPGDDVSVPNLVVSYRKEVMAGEPLEVEVLNIPDGSFDGEDITLSFAWRTPGGLVAKEFLPVKLRGGELKAAWFSEDASALVASPALVPELTVWFRGEKRVYSDGLWPAGIHASRAIEYKWAKHCLRELPRGQSGALEAARGGDDGCIVVKGRVESPRRLRSIAVIDETDTVYMYEGKESRDMDEVRVRIAFQAAMENGKGKALKGRISLRGADGARLRVARARGGVDVSGNEFVFSGAMYNNWPHYLYAYIPRDAVAGAVFDVDLSGWFKGSVSVADLESKEVFAFPGPKGGNLVFTRYLSQERIPNPQMCNSAEFSFKYRTGLPNSVLRLETVDEDYHVWRSKPLCFGKRTGETAAFNVFERDRGDVTRVEIDSSRLNVFDYVFEPSRGSVVAGSGGRFTWGILGGYVPLVTGFGQGESGYGNAGASRKGLKTAAAGKNGGLWTSAPEYVREPDGSWALSFSGGTYVSLPQQIWPVQCGFTLELEVNPGEVSRRQALLSTGPTSSALWIEKGKVFAMFFLRNKYMNVSGRAATVVVEGPEIAAGKWQTVRLVCDQKAAHLEVDGVRGAQTPVSGDIFYPQYTGLGVNDRGEWFSGKMKRFKIFFSSPH